MNFDALITITVVFSALGALASDRHPPEVVLTTGLAVLLFAGVLTPAEAFSGLGNPAVIALAGLYVLTAALQQTGALEVPARRLLASAKTSSVARLRLTMVTAPLSAFLNNTPIVATMMPVASGWAKRHGLSNRGLLLPLSYAAVLGGTCTLLGTATHLVVHGLLLERGMPGLSLFELLPIGLCLVVVGLPLTWIMARRLLDTESSPESDAEDLRREYTTDLVVTADSPLIGSTVESAQLRRLQGLFLIRIDRGHRVIAPVGPEEQLVAGDRLSFAGVLETIVDLQKRKGLEPADAVSAKGHWLLHEAVISRSSPLIGLSVREANFRGRYSAAVVAVHRHGGRIEKKIGDIVLRHGDTLLLQAAGGFARTFRDSRDFYLISEVADAERPRHSKGPLAMAILFGVIGTVAMDLLPIATAAIGGALLVVLSGCISVGAARRSIDAPVLVVIGAALGIAVAFEKSGVADLVSAVIAGAAPVVGPIGLLALIYVLGMVLTEFLTNTAAAALLFPIALSAAVSIGADPRPFVLATSISAAVSLATPLGYQTNMMVYGPGGYSFKDFLRLGVPLQLVCGVVAVTALAFLYDVG